MSDLVRRLRDPEWVKNWFDQAGFQAADRIEELEAKNRELALDVIFANGQAFDAYDAQKAAEENLAKVMTHVMEYSNDPHLVRWAEVVLAEIKESP